MLERNAEAGRKILISGGTRWSAPHALITGMDCVHLSVQVPHKCLHYPVRHHPNGGMCSNVLSAPVPRLTCSIRFPTPWWSPSNECTCSNVLPMDLDASRDFFTEGSPAALRGVLASWSLPECRQWCARSCCSSLLCCGHGTLTPWQRTHKAPLICQSRTALLCVLPMRRIERDLGLRLASEEATRKLFPASGDAREVRDRLVDACRRRGVRIQYGASVESLRAVLGSDPSAQTDQPAASSSHEARSLDGGRASQECSSRLRGTATATAVHANGVRPASARVDSSDHAPRWVCGLRDGSEVGLPMTSHRWPRPVQE